MSWKINSKFPDMTSMPVLVGYGKHNCFEGAKPDVHSDDVESILSGLVFKIGFMTTLKIDIFDTFFLMDQNSSKIFYRKETIAVIFSTSCFCNYTLFDDILQ